MSTPQELPPGVKLLRTIEGHEDAIYSIAFDARGGTLASGSADTQVKLWDLQTGRLLQTLWHQSVVRSVVFAPKSGTLASASRDGVKLWEAQSARLLRTFGVPKSIERTVAFDEQGRTLASGGHEPSVKIWDTRSGKLLRAIQASGDRVLSVVFQSSGFTLAVGSFGTATLWNAQTADLLGTYESRGLAHSVAFHPQGSTLAVGWSDKIVTLLDARSARLLHVLEGHTGPVDRVVFSPDGRLLASKSEDQTIRLWSCETWETVAVISAPTHEIHVVSALVFHPTLPLLATAGSAPDASEKERSRQIHLFDLNYDLLLSQRAAQPAASRAIHHTTGKIVLVGDHSVGKSALGHRLIHGRFETQESTHGQQFWVFPALGKHRADGTECEAILWDFAGQPDYRLVHALFVDNADLALVLFDASDLRDPLHGVDFWLKQLRTEQSRCPIILVAAQTDRGTSPLTAEELEAFCKRHEIVGPIVTSAATGAGIEELVERMKSLIGWEEKPATVTTATFKRIKDYVLGLKEAKAAETIVTPEGLRRLLEAADARWQFTEAEMLTAVGYLENYGYVKRLKTSRGELRILLQPERLNNLASSFVLEARRNPKGLGALEEKRLLAGGYDFPELKDLDGAERDVLLDSAALLFLEHNVCFRETDPLRMEPYLVFPELINLKKPPGEDAATEDGVSYTVSGPTENVFASLVVLLGYTHTFTRTAQWHNNARYEVGDGLVCGFRQEAERDGQLGFVFCFAPRVGGSVRTLFQGLFESFLARTNLTVTRYEPVLCTHGHLLNRAVVRDAMRRGEKNRFCSDCGENVTLPKVTEPIQLTREVKEEVDSQRRIAEQRTRFEQAVFRVRAFVAEQKITPPECFISYAWGEAEHERWVEKRLATDLQKAGIAVVLDRWDAQIGTDIGRFIARIEKIDRIAMVGTPLYRHKYENKDTSTGYVVAAEVDLINNRLMFGTEEQKKNVLPLLLAGETKDALPPLLHGRVHADFRNELAYFATAFDLILSLYHLPPNHSAVADLRESLREQGIR